MLINLPICNFYLAEHFLTGETLKVMADHFVKRGIKSNDCDDKIVNDWGMSTAGIKFNSTFILRSLF